MASPLLLDVRRQQATTSNVGTNLGWWELPRSCELAESPATAVPLYYDDDDDDDDPFDRVHTNMAHHVNEVATCTCGTGTCQWP